MIRLNRNFLLSNFSRGGLSIKLGINKETTKHLFTNKSISFEKLEMLIKSFKTVNFEDLFEGEIINEIKFGGGLMNCIQLMGRLTKDPELKTSGSTTYCRFSLAVPRGFGKDKITDFFNCTAFGKTAEAISGYVKKGEQLAVQGRMEFTTKDKVTYHTVSVSNVTFVSTKGSGSTDDFGEEPPKRQSTTRATKVKEAEQPVEDDDEYPF